MSIGPRNSSELSRAAFLLPSDRLGGSERVTKILIRAAIESDRFERIDVFFLCWNRTGTFDDLLASRIVKLHYTGANSGVGGLWSAVKFLAGRRFAFVFSSSLHLNALASFMRRIRVLRTNRLVARESTTIFDREFGWRGVFLRHLYFYYGKQDMIVCQTERMKRSLEENLGGRLNGLLVTLRNPIDLSRAQKQSLHAGAAGDELRIVWCGRLDRVKAPELALHIVAELRRRMRPVRLIVIGDGPGLESLQSLSSDLGIAEQVQFKGRVANPCQLMSSCHIGLITSYTEGFPNVVLEMLASGVRRILSTNCAGELASVPNVEVVNSRDPGAFVDCIEGHASCASAQEVMRFLEECSPKQFFSKIAAGT